MIEIELPIQVVLDGQVRDAAKNPAVDEDELRKIAGYARGIRTKDDENGKAGTLCAAGTAEGAIYGAEAAVQYCKNRGTELVPVKKVSIPKEVWDWCSGRMWIGISRHAASVESRANRLLRLLALAKESGEPLPEIILLNESRMLRDAVERLESNPDRGNGRLRWSDGSLVRCLNDAGWSLYNGWNEAMLERISQDNEDLNADLAADDELRSMVSGKEA